MNASTAFGVTNAGLYIIRFVLFDVTGPCGGCPLASEVETLGKWIAEWGLLVQVAPLPLQGTVVLIGWKSQRLCLRRSDR